MNHESPTYGVLGVGALGTALVTGLCDGVPDPPRVLLSPRSAGTAAELAGRFPTVSVAPDNQAVLDGSDVVLVCLRAQHASALTDLTWRREQVVISTMPGLGIAGLRELLAPATAVARAIAMPAVATRSTTTMVNPPLPELRALFDRLGGTVEIAGEQAFDALFTSSATVAPFFAYLGLLSDWLVEQGVVRDIADRQVASIFAGVMPTPEDAADIGFDGLVSEYATPGGVNERITALMREAGVFASMRAAVVTVHDELTDT